MGCVRILFTLIVLLGWRLDCYAELVERESEFGPTSITYDSLTDLEWLDVTNTTNMSVLDVESEMLEGGIYFGWRYATVEDLETLFFVSAGLPDNMYASPEDAPLYQELLRLFGITIDSVVPGCILCIHAVSGFTSGVSSADRRYITTLSIEWADGVVVGVWAGINSGQGVAYSAIELIGHWILRDAESVYTEQTSWGDVKARYR